MRGSGKGARADPTVQGGHTEGPPSRAASATVHDAEPDDSGTNSRLFQLN